MESSSSSVGEISTARADSSNLLTCGIAWAVSLTLRSILSEEMLKRCFPSKAGETDENLLYRFVFAQKPVHSRTRSAVCGLSFALSNLGGNLCGKVRCFHNMHNSSSLV